MTTDKLHAGNAGADERWEDPIVAEVRAVRDRIAAQFDYDIDRIVQHVSQWGAERRQVAPPGGRPRKHRSGSR